MEYHSSRLQLQYFVFTDLEKAIVACALKLQYSQSISSLFNQYTTPRVILRDRIIYYFELCAHLAILEVLATRIVLLGPCDFPEDCKGSSVSPCNHFSLGKERRVISKVAGPEDVGVSVELCKQLLCQLSLKSTIYFTFSLEQSYSSFRQE